MSFIRGIKSLFFSKEKTPSDLAFSLLDKIRAEDYNFHSPSKAIFNSNLSPAEMGKKLAEQKEQYQPFEEAIKALEEIQKGDNSPDHLPKLEKFVPLYELYARAHKKDPQPIVKDLNNLIFQLKTKEAKKEGPAP